MWRSEKQHSDATAPLELGLAAYLAVPELAWLRSVDFQSDEDGRAREGAPPRAVESTPRADTSQSAPCYDNVISLVGRREALRGQPGPGLPDTEGRSSHLGTAARWLGAAVCFVLCLPVLLFSVFLFGFVLIPLLPFIAGSLALTMSKDDAPPPIRPNLPAAARPAPAFEHAQAA